VAADKRRSVGFGGAVAPVSANERRFAGSAEPLVRIRETPSGRFATDEVKRDSNVKSRSEKIAQR